MYKLPQKKNIKLAKIRHIKNLLKNKIVSYKEWFVCSIYTDVFDHIIALYIPKTIVNRKQFESTMLELFDYVGYELTEQHISKFEDADAFNQRLPNGSAIFILRHCEPLQLLPLLAHEISHSIFDIFNKIRSPITSDTEETFAHIHQYIFIEALKFLKTVFTIKI